MARLAREIRPQSEATGPYELLACTVNLGATATKPGHRQLKHCFAKLVGANGELARTWAIGLRGVVPEAHPDLESVDCRLQAQGLSEAAVQRFDAALNRCAGRAYRWGENDCCACLERAVRQGLKTLPNEGIRQAARDIAAAPDMPQSL